MTERKPNNRLDFSIERILGVERSDDRQEIAADIKDVELSAASSSSSSSSCDEEDLFRRNIEETAGNSSSTHFPDASSWLQNSYGCPPFFNRGWFSQTIRPPFFTLQGKEFFKCFVYLDYELFWPN
jgi:hypothetical protein